MRAKLRRPVPFLLTLALAVSLLLFRPGFSQEELHIQVGSASPSVGNHSHAHDVTVDALKKGTAEYLLKGSSEGSHRVVLTKQQIADLLNGTTVIVQSEKSDESGKIRAHQHRVTLTVKAEERERSGW